MSVKPYQINKQSLSSFGYKVSNSSGTKINSLKAYMSYHDDRALLLNKMHLLRKYLIRNEKNALVKKLDQDIAWVKKNYQSNNRPTFRRRVYQRRSPAQRASPRRRRRSPAQRASPRRRRRSPAQRASPRRRRRSPAQRASPRRRRRSPAQRASPRRRRR